MIFRLFILTFLFQSIASFANDKPTTVNVPLDRAYAPVGFDDNDRVQITVAGTFSNSCFRVQDSGVNVDEKQQTIHVWQTAYKYGGNCLRMMVPFTQVVNVGLIAAGQYTVLDKASGSEIGKVAVVTSTHPEADDYFYAPIHDAYLDAEVSGDKAVILVGEFSDACTEIDDVKVAYYPEAIVVQPIARRSEGVCTLMKMPFIKKVDLDPSLKGTRLLHVRSMNGQAINKIVETDLVP